MRNLLRNPLTWMVLAECAVVAALVMVAWHLLASAAAHPAPSFTGVAAPTQAGTATGPVSADAAQPKPRVLSLLPGLNVDANFWRQRLADLNRDQTAFEQLEREPGHALRVAAPPHRGSC